MKICTRVSKSLTSAAGACKKAGIYVAGFIIIVRGYIAAREGFVHHGALLYYI